MRTLMWFTLGFGAACAFCIIVFVPVFLTAPFCLLAASCFAFLRDAQWLKKTGLLLLGLAAGIFWFARFENRILKPIYELDGVTKEMAVRFHSYGEETDYGIRAEGTIQLDDREYPVMVYLDDDAAAEPGVVLKGPFRFQVTAPGGGKESGYYQGKGIFLLAYQQDELTVSSEPKTWKDFPVYLRQKILETLNAALPADTSSFAKALLLGDSSDLDYQTLTDFTVSGIRHIIAVSGLHVSILFGLLGLVTLRKRFLSALIGFPVLLIFAALTGFTPSVCRACIMSGMVLMASLVNREYDGITSLSFAGLVLLIINPLVIVSASYQLSFASVAGIFAFTPPIRKWIQSALHPKKQQKVQKKLADWLSMSISVTLGATVTTVPFCAYYFGTVSLAAVLTNLMVLWAVSVIFYGLAGICLLFALLPSGAMLIGKILSVLIRYVLLVSEVIADFPLSAIYTRSPFITAWLVFVYVLLLAMGLGKNKSPHTLLCCSVIGLCLSLLASWTEPLRSDVRFTVLDVGQGQCLLFQTEGRTYMVDCGGSNSEFAADIAAETLLSQGISNLDGLILTHYDEDHSGGAEYLLSRIGVELLILPNVYSELQLGAKQILYASENMSITFGNAEITVFPSYVSGNSNENSLCILFDTSNCDILVTGDRDMFGERMLLRYADIPDVDILVAGHHGSKYSTDEQLLEAACPEIVCISVGSGNAFGHPAPEVLQRLARYGCAVYRTDLHGDIVIRR